MKSPNKTRMVGLLGALLVPLLIAVPLTSHAQEYISLPDGSKLKMGSKCAVCGMTVGGDLRSPAAYGWTDGTLTGYAGVAAAVFNDGKVVGFEGARCLFIYNTIPKRFGINVDNIEHRFVTEFESGRLMDVNRTYLVLGSKVRGPMGFDLIPFEDRDKAEAFKEKHEGKRVVTLDGLSGPDVERDE